MIMMWMGMWTGMGEGMGMGMGEDDFDDVEHPRCHWPCRGVSCHFRGNVSEIRIAWHVCYSSSNILVVVVIAACLSVCPSSCLSAVYTASFCACRACRRSGDKRPLYLWDTQWPLYLRGASLFADRCCICCSTLSSTFPSHIFPHNISKFVELPKNSKTA